MKTKNLEISFSPLLMLRPSADSKKKQFILVDPISNEPQNEFIGNCPGIYVWGFENNRGDFIPYYVGDSIKSIVGRINVHKKDIEKDKSTYVRLSKEYLYGINKTPYWFDPHFPTDKGKGIPPKWCKETVDKGLRKVDYWQKIDGANKDIKQFCDVNGPSRESIDSLCIPDPDRNGKFVLNENFRLFYWDLNQFNSRFNSDIRDFWNKISVEKSKMGKCQREFLEIFEAYIKFALKGKTASKSINIETMKSRFKSLFPNLNISISNKSNFAKLFHINEGLDEVEYHDYRDGFGNTDPYCNL